MDFKGHFALGDASRCHALTILDDHSRYLVGLKACAGERAAIVQGHLESCFRTHGLPEAILRDHGSPWSGPRAVSTRRPRCGCCCWACACATDGPSTRRLKARMNASFRTLKADLLTRRDFADLASAQPHFDAFRHLYNHDGPHQALGDAVPASRYRPSSRTWREPDADFAYAPGATVRTVKSKGEITCQNRFFYLGAAFRRYAVGLVPTSQDGVFATTPLFFL